MQVNRAKGDLCHLPSFRLDGRIAVVTGASDGIGRAIALGFAQAGASLVLASRRADALDRVRQEIVTLGGRATTVVLDVTNIRSITSLATRLEQEGQNGDAPLILVNNAGVPFSKSALETTEEDWDLVLDTHLKGTFFCSQAIGRVMIARGYGKIINMSSTWARSTDNSKCAYSAAKAAVSHLTASLSTEWAPSGVRVNAIAPTAILTAGTREGVLRNPQRAKMLLSRIPLQRYETTDDLIGAAIFLASEASDFMTGQTMFVDGGWNAAR